MLRWASDDPGHTGALPAARPAERGWMCSDQVSWLDRFVLAAGPAGAWTTCQGLEIPACGYNPLEGPLTDLARHPLSAGAVCGWLWRSARIVKCLIADATLRCSAMCIGKFGEVDANAPSKRAFDAVRVNLITCERRILLKTAAGRSGFTTTHFKVRKTQF